MPSTGVEIPFGPQNARGAMARSCTRTRVDRHVEDRVYTSSSAPAPVRSSDRPRLGVAGVDRAEVVVELVEPVTPDPTVLLDPIPRPGQRLGLEVTRPELRPTSAEMSPHRSSTLRCFEIVGSERSNGAPSSLTVASPAAKRVRIERRVGSASAANVASSCARSISSFYY